VQISSLQKVAEDFSKLTPEELTLNRIRLLNESALISMSFNYRQFEEKSSAQVKDNDYFKNLISDVIKIHKTCIQKYEDRLSIIEDKVPIAENRIESITNEFLNEQSFFIVRAVLINSGRSNISIKAHSLLRVYSRAGNYIDINMLLQDHEKRSEIPAYKTQTALFKSPTIDRFPKEDRQLLNTSWNKSDYSILFIEDTLGNIHSSNKIRFSEGTYERIIYNRLATEASKPKYFLNGQ
jgi:hypothetical protein